MTTGGFRLRRIAAVVLVAVILPACGKSFRVAPTLFTDGFNGAFPGTAWTGPTLTGPATAAIDGATGLPAGSLEMTSPGPTAGTAETDTVLAFSNPNVTISVHMAAFSGGAGEIGTGVVSILDSTPAVVATATWNNATNQVTLSIPGGSADSIQTVTRDGTFYRLVFNVNSAGTASWTFNNGSILVNRALFPAGMLKVRLSSSFGTTAPLPSFFFDNVNVTSP
jgi:hypothetical protein